MLLFLLLIPLLGTGPCVALVCVRASRPSQLGARRWGWSCLAVLLPLRGRVQGSTLWLGSGGAGKGQTGLHRRAHREAGDGLCSVVCQPVVRLGENGWAVVAEMFPRSHHHCHQGWVWGQEDGQQHLFFPVPPCPLPQGARSHHAEGPLPITSLQKPVFPRERVLPPESGDSVKIWGGNSSQ